MASRSWVQSRQSSINGSPPHPTSSPANGSYQPNGPPQPMLRQADEPSTLMIGILCQPNGPPQPLLSEADEPSTLMAGISCQPNGPPQPMLNEADEPSTRMTGIRVDAAGDYV